jgi:hypothetical protein
MPSTYTPIASSVLTTTAASVVFSSVPQTYTDLVVVVDSTFTGTSGRYISLQYNNDSAGNYSMIYAGGSGSGTLTANFANDLSARIGNGSNNNARSTVIANVMNYTNTTTYKISFGRAATNEYAIAYCALWRGSTGSAFQAITSVTVTCDGASGNVFAAGSIFSLYGIKAA